MQYFSERAPTHREALEQIRSKYGSQAVILTHRAVSMGGFLGFFTREGVEVTGYLSHDPPRKKAPDLEDEKKKILSSLKNDQTLALVLKEVQAIKERVDSGPQAPPAEHSTIRLVEDLLIRNDFSPGFIREIEGLIKSTFSLGGLENADVVQERVIDWIGERISIFRPDTRTKPRIFVLVGPTGVGKTTTIAKLAAMYGIGTTGVKPVKVRMITIDTYRIAAKEQLETYGGIMGIPVTVVQFPQELRKSLDLFTDVDIIFIDTIGKSPRDFRKLAEMRELLDACSGTAETHLAISATTKTSDIMEVMQQFEPFRYQSVIITKLDETARVGNILSVLHEKNKSVSYLTDGQKVPQDIERATVVRLLMNLEGFRINRIKLEEKFAKRT